MERITLCLIVKNEEQYLERCIQSVASLVEEIIIVDTGSSDNTVKIAKKYTDKIFYKELDNNFSNVRNYAIDQATLDWILFLDADEFFEAYDLNQLKKLLSTNIKKDVGAIKFYVYNFFNTGGWFTGHVLRFFRNRKRFIYINPMGERIEPSILKEGYKILNPDIILNHTGHCKTPESRYRKTDVYIDICKKNILENKNDTLAHSYLEINSRNNGFLDTAYTETKIGVENNEISFLAQSFYGSVLRSINLNKEALEAYEKASKYAPENMKGIMDNLRGVILISEKRYDEAIVLLKETYSKNKVLVHILINLGIAYFFKKEYDQALTCFLKVIKRNSYFLTYEEVGYFESDPYKSLTYETIYGYPGLGFLIAFCEKEEDRIANRSKTSFLERD